MLHISIAIYNKGIHWSLHNSFYAYCARFAFSYRGGQTSEYISLQVFLQNSSRHALTTSPKFLLTPLLLYCTWISKISGPAIWINFIRSSTMISSKYGGIYVAGYGAHSATCVTRNLDLLCKSQDLAKQSPSDIFVP